MKIFLFTIVILILLFFFIRFLEQKSLYFPFRKIEVTPKDTGLVYDDISITTKDGIQISAWFIPAESSRATVLFCHGNGGNISHRLEKIRILHDIDLHVFIFDYRGYGTSTGSPSENGLYLDAEAAYDFLVNEKGIPSDEIVGYGESLGGAVVTDLAAKRELGGIIVEGSFTSVRDMAKRILPFIPRFVYKSNFNSFEKIKDVKEPKLIFHSINDDIVPFDLGEKLFDNAPEPKEFVRIQGGHNDAFLTSRDIFISKIDAFISGL